MYRALKAYLKMGNSISNGTCCLFDPGLRRVLRNRNPVKIILASFQSREEIYLQAQDQLSSTPADTAFLTPGKGLSFGKSEVKKLS